MEPAFVARSPVMREMLEHAELFARADVTVLIEGATGSGKAYVAEYIHVMSRRRNAAFCHANLAATDDPLAGSDLFGHARGSFTGATQHRTGYLASANGGTVFLDEIGKASKAVQAKLLHVIEHGEFCALGEDRPRVIDVRFIAAASEGLGRLVAADLFLEDLRQRLCGFRVVVPELRHRREDIPELIEQFACVHAERCSYGDRPPLFEPALVRAMTKAPWPGNLRQLSAAVELAMIFARGADRVTLAHCLGDLGYLVELGRKKPRREDAVIAEALERAGGNKSEAARIAGVCRATMHRWAKKQGGG
jgi:two-component system response regulator HydG